MALRDVLASSKKLMKVWRGISNFVASIHWPGLAALFNSGVYYKLTEADHNRIRQLLANNYVIILTRRKTHLTTYLINLASKLKTGKSTYYTHALMNVEGEVNGENDYQLIEATAKGVHYSTFMEVFDCDSVALFKPRGVALSDWTIVLDAVKAEHGLEYDTLFDLQDAEKVSCVEMVYQGLKKLPNWKTEFPELVKLIEQSENELTPQMLYDCGDLELIFEVRR